MATLTSTARTADAPGATLDVFRAYHDAWHALTTRLVRTLPDDVLAACADRLGTASDGSLVRHPKREWPVLLDLALHEPGDSGQSAIDQLLSDADGLDPVEVTVLEGLRHSTVRVLDVDRCFPDLGLRGIDVWSGDELAVVDPLLVRRVGEGDRVVARTVPLPELQHLTTDATMPLSDQGLFSLVDALDAADLDPIEVAECPRARRRYAAVVYRCALHDPGLEV